MPLTVGELYEAYMDEGAYAPEAGQEPTPFAEDIWEYFGMPTGETGEYFYDPQEWAKDWGAYIPGYDPTQVDLAERERSLSLKKAEETLGITQAAISRTYQEELEKLETKIGSEIAKGREMSGRLGLRSGTIDTAIEDSLEATSNQAKDLSDRLILTQEETENTYHQDTIDANLDFDKSEYEAKRQWYDKVLASIQKLTELDAFVSAEGCDQSAHQDCIAAGWDIHPDDRDAREAYWESNCASLGC